MHYGLPGFRTAVTSPAQGDDWFSKFKRWRLAKAVRLIKELEIYRNFVPADLIRQWLIGIQPGIAPLRQRPSQQAEFVLWLPLVGSPRLPSRGAYFVCWSAASPHWCSCGEL